MKNVKIAFIHPYKHHSYHSLEGIIQYSNDVTALFGYYKQNDLIDKIVYKTKYAKKVDGYYNKKISEYVQTNFFIKIFFLLDKLCPKFHNVYLALFQRWCISVLKKKRFDVIHVLQDYCNDVVEYAHKSGITIVYEQIQPFDILQKQVLEDERKKIMSAGIKVSCQSKISKQKINRQLSNLKWAKAIICASKVTMQSISPYTSTNTFIKMFPYGAELSKSGIAMKKSTELKKSFKMLYIGQLNLLKGVWYIIQAARRLSAFKEISFTIVGLPTDSEDQFLIEEIKSTSNINYIPYIVHSEINKIYQEHDAFIFQGLCEGFGMVTLEAMAMGLPCLVSEGGRGIVIHEQNGLINKNGEAIEIEKNILRLYKDPDLLTILSKNAQTFVEDYSWERYSKEILQTYQVLEY